MAEPPSVSHGRPASGAPRASPPTHPSFHFPRLPTFDLPLPRLLPRDPILAIVLMFALTQLLAVPAGILLISAAKLHPEVAALSVAPTGTPDDPLNAVFFVAYVLGGAVGILLVIRFFKGGVLTYLLRFLEFSVVSGSVAVLLFAYLNVAASMPFAPALLLSSVSGLLFGICKFFLPSLKNIAAILSSAGVGAIFGFSMGFWPALAFILALSLYDYIAVFRTRHMLVMAQALGTRSLSFTITADAGTSQSVPAKTKTQMAPPDLPSPSAPAGSRASAADSHPSSPSAAPHPSHGVDRLDLGSGDLAIPAMLAVSSYTIAGLPGAFAVMVGAIISIALLLRLVVEKRVALPALPPICLGGLLALLVVKLAGF